MLNKVYLLVLSDRYCYTLLFMLCNDTVYATGKNKLSSGLHDSDNLCYCTVAIPYGTVIAVRMYGTFKSFILVTDDTIEKTYVHYYNNNITVLSEIGNKCM
jgi:hypothetical protein